MLKRCLCLFLVVFLLIPGHVYASVPYQSYSFDNWMAFVPSPVPYVPEVTINNLSLGISPLSRPADMFVCPNRYLYIADTGNNRIIVVDDSYKLVRIIEYFTRDGQIETFSNPNGLFVDASGNIYVADTGNNRVVAFDTYGEMFLIIDSLPEIADSVAGFVPLKITVNRDGRVYVIDQNVFEGILTYSPTGEFISFFGRIDVRVNPWDWLWSRILATQAQRERTLLYIPMEFNNLDIDSRGFIFATYICLNDDQRVKRLNPLGTDILQPIIDGRGISPIIGDLFWTVRGPGSGPSNFIDVKARTHGMFSVLDNTRNRVFTYDSEGNLLYVFGGAGNIEGMTRRPVALEVMGDRILILEQNRGDVTVFKPTEYGYWINRAVAYRYDGMEQEAVAAWREVLRLNAHFELAFAGIGKSLLASGNHREALYYLRRGNNTHFYSIAFRRFRTEVMSEYSNWILSGVLLAAVLYATVKIKKHVKRGRKENDA